MACYIENLSLGHWLRTIWPDLRREIATAKDPPSPVYYIEGSGLAVSVARRMLPRIGLRLEPLELNAGRMFDESGKLLWLRIAHHDMFEALRFIAREPAFGKFREASLDSDCFRVYLRKRCLPGVNNLGRHGLWRALWVIQSCLWHARQHGNAGLEVRIFLNNRPWIAAVANYAAAAGPVTLVPLGGGFNPLAALKQLVGRDLRMVLEKIGRLARGELSVLVPRRRTRPGPAPCIALQYYGQFNLDRPEKHSDFFFWQRSGLRGENVLALFGFPQDPLDEQRHGEMAHHGIRAEALRYRATTLPAQAVFGRTFLVKRVVEAVQAVIPFARSTETRWLRTEALAFRGQREYWTQLFLEHNARIFATWFKYTADHCPIAEAMRGVGGVLAIYQRAYEGVPNAKFTVASDVLFSFAKQGALIEAASGSHIDYHVTTGYLGDHRFPLLRQEASRVRDALLARGARFIAAFLDENSFDDPRWGPGHDTQSSHYLFLLEKVLAEPEFGLVLKPKSPRTLKRRLGPVAKLLDEALATRRCEMFDDGVLHGATPPAQAALAADVAIHSSVSSGTAGMEAALAGVPTVVIDDEGWTVSPLYQLGPNRVIFSDYAALWHTWREHRTRAGGVPGFGDWSPVLDELDPFRDGRAAERMGTYLKWLIEGYEAGLPKETVLSDAAERYCLAWGRDKVTSVRPSIG